MEVVQLPKNITPTTKPLESTTIELDDQIHPDYPAPTVNVKTPRRKKVKEPENQKLSFKSQKMVKKPSTLEPKDENLSESSSSINNSNNVSKNLGSFKGSKLESNSLGNGYQSESKSLNDIDTIKRRVLETTNNYRRKHDLPELELDNTVST